MSEKNKNYEKAIKELERKVREKDEQIRWLKERRNRAASIKRIEKDLNKFTEQKTFTISKANQQFYAKHQSKIDAVLEQLLPQGVQQTEEIYSTGWDTSGGDWAGLTEQFVQQVATDFSPARAREIERWADLVMQRYVNFWHFQERHSSYERNEIIRILKKGELIDEDELI